MTLVTMTIPSADLLTLATNPVEIVPAPGPGLIIVVRNAWFRFHAGTTPYTNYFTSPPGLFWEGGSNSFPTQDVNMAAVPNSTADPAGGRPIQGANDQLYVMSTQGLATNQVFPVNHPLWFGAGVNLAGAGPMASVAVGYQFSGYSPRVPGDEFNVGSPPSAFAYGKIVITSVDSTPGYNFGDFLFTQISGPTIAIVGDVSANIVISSFPRIYPAESGFNGQGQVVSATYGVGLTEVVLADPNGTLGTVPATGNLVLPATQTTGIDISDAGDHYPVIGPGGLYSYWINPQPGLGYTTGYFYTQITATNYTPPADMGSVTLYVEYEVIAA